MKKVKRILVTCPNCGEFFSLSVDNDKYSNDYVCPNCREPINSSRINAALDNAKEYNNLVNWFEHLKDFGIEIIFDNR